MGMDYPKIISRGVIMSIFSGKCDVFDWFYDKDDEYIKKCKFYTATDYLVPLRIDNHHDLAPYYPYIVGIGGWNNDHAELYISTESYIDEEERDRLQWKLDDVKRYWRRCKRKKIPYDVEKATQIISFIWTSNGVEQEIAKRVAEDGEKATIDGLHDYIHEHYRYKLLDEMIRLGWDKRYAKWWIWKDIKYLFEGDSDES